MDTTQTTTHVGLCAGYGGIELGLKRVIPNLRSVALCEIEAFACANLVAKMEAGLLDAAPIWTDLKTFPWDSFRGKVDILTGGYPCQPFSAAGKRQGADDPRHLWPFISAGIAAMRPSVCFFENVEGHISLGLPDVIEDLAGLGYRTTWGIFSAAEVGAPHQRKRVFILAHRECEGLERFYNRNTSAEPSEYVSADAWASSECGTWPSRPGEQQFAWEPPRVVADTKGNQRRLSSDSQSTAERWRAAKLGRADDAGAGTLRANTTSTGSGSEGGDQWPSRPGEPQHEWEPPRVVANAAVPRFKAQRDESNCEWRQGFAGESSAMGNASQLFSDGSNNHSRISERSKEIPKSGNASWNELGNSKCICIPTAREHGAMDEASGISTNGEGCEPTQADPITGATREREGNGSNASECGEIECEVGRNAYEPSIGVDFAELSGLCDSELAEIREWMVKTDNRTDELRLLGNGVVPATAERAFTILSQQFNS